MAFEKTSGNVVCSQFGGFSKKLNSLVGFFLTLWNFVNFFGKKTIVDGVSVGFIYLNHLSINTSWTLESEQ